MHADTLQPRGLLHAVLLDGSGGCRRLGWPEVARWESGDGCLWLHFSLDDTDAARWITEDSGLTEIASSALLTEETRPRTLHRDKRLLLALRGVNPRITDEPDDMISLRIWTDGERVLSTRFRGLESTDRLIAALQNGEGPGSVQALLEQWIDGIVARLKATVDSFEDRVMELNERILSGDSEGVQAQLADVRRQLISIRRYLAPQREALQQLAGAGLPWLDEHHRLLLREVNDRLVRYIEDLDEVRERAILAHEELMSRVSEAMNRRAYLFTVVATIFLPLGFLTGLLGVNVGGMPGTESASAFWLFTTLCVILMAVLAILFRFNRWL